MVSAEPVTLDDLRARCEEQGLARAKWPEYMVEIDKIPLSAIGKVRRTELEELVVKRMNEERSD